MSAPLSLRRRLAILGSAAGVLLVLAVIVSALSFRHLLSDRRHLIRRIDPAALTTQSLLAAYLDEEAAVRGYVLTGNPALLDTFQQDQTDAVALSGRLRQLTATPSLDVATQRAATWEDQVALPAVRANPLQLRGFATMSALNHSKVLFDSTRAAFASLQADLTAQRTAATARLDDSTHRLAVALAGGLILALVAAAISWWALRTWVMQPLEALAADTRDVAGGNLTHPIAPVGPPELVAFAGDLEAMRRRIVGELESVEAARAELAALNEDLARSNVELEQFAYVASHDLQEPVRKVISFCQLLADRYRGQLDERGDQYIDFAVDGAKRMQVLINDLLAFSRVGRSTEGFRPVHLSDVATLALRNLAGSIEDTDAHVHVGALPTVSGDATLLTALFQNMVGNAIKFRSPPPAVPVIDISATHIGNEWTITITDNGIGIEPRFADRIFVIFQRLHGREAYEGTGIGLAMCRKIVEFHGGRIWLDTTFTSGTRFRFTLPAGST